MLIHKQVRKVFYINYKIDKKKLLSFKGLRFGGTAPSAIESNDRGKNDFMFNVLTILIQLDSITSGAELNPV